MATIVHLSDLHLLARIPDQGRLLRTLCAALRAVTPRADLLVFTGDVLDSATLPPRAVRQFAAWLDALQHVLGGAVPTVLIPGNHDVRNDGVFGPHDPALYCSLRDALRKRPWVTVHGGDPRALTALVPGAFHRLPLDLIAVDSTYLASGWASAGGTLRTEDLLQVHAELPEGPPGRPFLLLVHHHLIPTPITDLGAIETHGHGALKEWAVRKFLPSVVSNADREELTMTALGAGTALTTLQTFGRAGLILHGHKHYPTVRLLRGTLEGQGDLVLASAGSCGTPQAWAPSADTEGSTLWPSFNLVDLQPGGPLRIETVAFEHNAEDPDVPKTVRRPLLMARQQGAAWELTERPRERAPTGTGPRLERNAATYELRASHGFPGARWSARVRREVAPDRGASPRLHGDYVERVEGMPGVHVEALAGVAGLRTVAPHTFELTMDWSTPTDYLLLDGLCATVSEDTRVRGPDSPPFEWVGLFNRYACGRAELTLRGLPGRVRVFGSFTDLTTGLERPFPLRAEPPGGWVLRVEDCQPRALLRIYWPLEG